MNVPNKRPTGTRGNKIKKETNPWKSGDELKFILK